MSPQWNNTAYDLDNLKNEEYMNGHEYVPNIIELYNYVVANPALN